jgi:hypothetical protein
VGLGKTQLLVSHPAPLARADRHLLRALRGRSAVFFAWPDERFLRAELADRTRAVECTAPSQQTWYGVVAARPTGLSPLQARTRGARVASAAVRDAAARLNYLNKTVQRPTASTARGSFTDPFGRHVPPTNHDEPNQRAASLALQGVEQWSLPSRGERAAPGYSV